MVRDVSLGRRHHGGGLLSRGLRPPATRTSIALACLVLAALAGEADAAGSSLRFFGNAQADVDRVAIRIDGPATPADVGATDFTLEFWMKAPARENAAPAIQCGANADWLLGNVIVDRDRASRDRRFGVSIAGGRVVFGVGGEGSGDRTICGVSDVRDEHWHHVAVQRRRADGHLWLHVDGVLEAEADGPDGDVSYPDGGACGGSCAATDPFLVLGGRKEDGGGPLPSFGGWLDEIRLSRTLRYASEFTRPTAPFAGDAATVALYHLDENAGDVVGDSSHAAGGPSPGARHLGGAPAGPWWSTDTAPLDAPAIALVPIATQLEKPTAIAHAGDGSGRLFIALQDGRILVHDGQRLLPDPFLDLRDVVACCDVGGLVGLAFHPRYADNGVFFVDYNDATGASIVARYTVSSDPDHADHDSAAVLLDIPHFGHSGGQLAFGPDGYLYIATGDGTPANDPPGNAQNPGTLLGKLLRIDVDRGSPYAVPADNPFASTPGARPEIWALGLRNPWRFAFDRATGDLFIGDVGQEHWEEIDFQPASSRGGENYGWKSMEASHCFDPPTGCDAAGLTLPILEYSHAVGCAVMGGYRYRGRQIPALHGAYVHGDLCSGDVWGASQDGAGGWSTVRLLDTALLISAFGEDEAGELHVAHRPENATGAVYRIAPASPRAAPLPTGLAPAAVIAGDPGFTLAVNGSGFAASSVVRCNGEDRPTTFVSSDRLTAEIPWIDVAAAGRTAVSVFTPVPGGGLSDALPLDVSPALFHDVSPGSWGASFVNTLALAGVTAGCGTLRFCPDEPVTRAQMAILLLRAALGPSAAPLPATGTVFVDVDAHAFGADWIEQLAGMGVTAGCGGGAYCPDRAITRAETAVLLLRARHGASYRPLSATGSMFDDVPAGHPLAAWIEQLAAEGITAGCGGGRYCPDSVVTRAEMAVFLVRAFALARPLP